MKKKKDSRAAEQSKNTVEYVMNIEKESLKLLETVEDTKAETNAFYPELLNKDVPEEEICAKAASLKRASSNITKALAQTYAVSDEFNARWHDIKKRRKKRALLSAPANAEIDMTESRSEHFARGLNIYKILLLCFIGSFAGVVIEMIWCLVTNGYIESRSGLVYGPFNLLYGVGAFALTVSLYNLRNHSRWLSFLGGLVIGSVIEYACSFGQELLFGSRSWDYSDMPFNINGRICLLYSIFWGFLGMLWIKNLYPRLAAIILKIPDKIGKIVTWVMVVFLVFDAAVSLIAVERWVQRREGIPASNGFLEFIDERFDDDRMKKIYANMVFGDEKDTEKEEGKGILSEILE